MDPVKYQPFDGKDGIKLENGTLASYKDGEEVEMKLLPQRIARSRATLADLIQDYLIPSVLTETEFCITEPATVLVEMDVMPSDGFELGGSVTVDDRPGIWTARREGSNAFLFRSHMPKGLMDYAKGEPRGMGWAWEIPFCIRELDDPALRKRVLLGMEKCLYRLIDQSVTVILPYRFEVHNIFSKEQPMWPHPLPLLRNNG